MCCRGLRRTISTLNTISMTAPFLQLLLSFPSHPSGFFMSSRCPSPTPLSPCDFTLVLQHNIMHHGACAHCPPWCKCHCATNSKPVATMDLRVTGANKPDQCIHMYDTTTYTHSQAGKEPHLHFSLTRDLRESSHWPQHSSGKDDVKYPLLLCFTIPFNSNSYVNIHHKMAYW